MKHKSLFDDLFLDNESEIWDAITSIKVAIYTDELLIFSKFSAYYICYAINISWMKFGQWLNRGRTTRSLRKKFQSERPFTLHVFLDADLINFKIFEIESVIFRLGGWTCLSNCLWNTIQVLYLYPFKQGIFLGL